MKAVFPLLIGLTLVSVIGASTALARGPDSVTDHSALSMQTANIPGGGSASLTNAIETATDPEPILVATATTGDTTSVANTAAARVEDCRGVGVQLASCQLVNSMAGNTVDTEAITEVSGGATKVTATSNAIRYFNG